MKLTQYHKATIIGFWRMGADERIISYIIGCDAIDVLYVIRSYELYL